MVSNQTTTTHRTRSVDYSNAGQQLHAAQIADALLTLRTASQISGLSSATLYRKAAADPTFPKLVKMGARCTRIRAGDLTAWLAAQARK